MDEESEMISSIVIQEIGEGLRTAESYARWSVPGFTRMLAHIQLVGSSPPMPYGRRPRSLKALVVYLLTEHLHEVYKLDLWKHMDDTLDMNVTTVWATPCIGR